VGLLSQLTINGLKKYFLVNKANEEKRKRTKRQKEDRSLRNKVPISSFRSGSQTPSGGELWLEKSAYEEVPNFAKNQRID
jgi:hypothetical protein